MRICVFGAGATGGHFAVRLAAAGHDVSVIARGPHLDAIRASGLAMRVGDEEVRAPVRAAEDPAELGEQDVVIVGVKATGLPAVAGRLRPLVGPDTRVVFPQNGMAWWYPLGLREGLPTPPDLPIFRLGERFLQEMDREQVVGGIIYSANEVARPGVVVNNTPRYNALWIQSITDPGDEAVAALRAELAASGVSSEAQEDIRATVWRKLLLNMSGSSLALATFTRSSDVRDDPALKEIYRRVTAEGLAIAAAHGYPLEVDVDRILAGMPKHKPSLLQDYEQGRPMEIAEIVLAPQAFARAAGIDTPTLDTIAAIVARLARERGLYAG